MDLSSQTIEDFPDFSLCRKILYNFIFLSVFKRPATILVPQLVHIIGNAFFGRLFSWLLGQHVTDTLCGTKVLLRRDYRRMRLVEAAWPDFDLLFEAAKLGLRMVEMPVHYMQRIHGESKMKTFEHGLMLLENAAKGFVRLKLIRKR